MYMYMDNMNTRLAKGSTLSFPKLMEVAMVDSGRPDTTFLYYTGLFLYELYGTVYFNKLFSLFAEIKFAEVRRL